MLRWPGLASGILSTALLVPACGCRREPRATGAPLERTSSCQVTAGCRLFGSIVEDRGFDFLLDVDGQLLFYVRSSDGCDLFRVDPSLRKAEYVRDVPTPPGISSYPSSGQLVAAEGGTLLAMVGHGVEQGVRAAYIKCVRFPRADPSQMTVLEERYETALCSMQLVCRDGDTMPIVCAASVQRQDAPSALTSTVDFFEYDRGSGEYGLLGRLESSYAGVPLAYAWAAARARLLCVRRLPPDVAHRGSLPSDSDTERFVDLQLGALVFGADRRAVWTPDPQPPFSVPSQARWCSLLLPEDGSAVCV
jgi:hypothetical protein